MSDTLPAIAGQNLTTQQKAAITKSKPLRVTGKLKSALDYLVWEGGSHDYQSAAQKAGLTTRAVRLALDRPHVKQYLQQQRHVLLTSERARNIHAAIDVRDQLVNQTARIQAVKMLEEMAEERTAAPGQRITTPGIVIQINAERSRVMADQGLIEVNPLSDHDEVQQGDTERDDGA